MPSVTRSPIVESDLLEIRLYIADRRSSFVEHY
jgi:hypothetical protein